MVRTQIQLPSQVHARLKRLALTHEWSLAEAIRRAAEEFLDRYPSPGNVISEWTLPEPMDLGTRPLSAKQIKELGQMSTTEEALLRGKGAWPFQSS